MYQAAKRVGVSPPFFIPYQKSAHRSLIMSFKARQFLTEGFVFAEKGYIQLAFLILRFFLYLACVLTLLVNIFLSFRTP